VIPPRCPRCEGRGTVVVHSLNLNLRSTRDAAWESLDLICPYCGGEGALPGGTA
jgi:Zn finger protein HypA/HybF involved in hydrogenase expression